MSVNITVNGNLSKCVNRKPSILDDREHVKKQREDNLRKIRLLQVRDECSNIARKIRGDFNTEKGKQLQSLDDIKAQELDSWRNQALVHKHYHYCNAVNQIGAAHLAAKEENESRAKREKERAETQKQFKKQLVSRVASKKDEIKQNKKLSKTNDAAKDNAKRTSTQTKTSKSPQKKAKRTQGTSNKDTKSKAAKKDNKKETSDDDDTNDDDKRIGNLNKVTKSKTPKKSKKAENRSHDDTNESDEHRRNLNKGPKSKTPKKSKTSENRSNDDSNDSDDHRRNLNKGTKSKTPKKSKTAQNRSHDNTNDSDERRRNLNKRTKSKTPKKSKKAENRYQDDASDSDEQRKNSNKGKKSKTPKRSNRTENRYQDETNDSDEQREGDMDCSCASSICSTSNAESDSDTDSSARQRHTKEGKSTEIKKNSKKMEKTPTVVLDVEPVNSGTMEVSTPCEINDKHTETNRKFSCVVSGDEEKGKTKSKRVVIDFHCNSNESISITVPPPVNKPRKPFFTQITDLVNKYSSTPTETQPEFSQGTTTPATRSISPHKCPHKSPERCSQKCHNIDTTKTTTTDTTKTSTTDTAKTTTTTTTATSSCTTNKSQDVQYYDYNNKYSKNYPQPTSSVRATPRGMHERNAMQEATIENKLEEARRHELNKKSQLADERGRKALDREQVRRDCQELTELLDKISKQRRRSLLPTDADLIGTEQYNNIKKRKECRMNAEIEDMLLEPAIITCPEVNINRNYCREEQYAKRPCLDSNIINLAEKPCDNMNDLESSECSILLDLVTDQGKQIENELKNCETLQQPNNPKISKLKYLLQQIEELRNSLIQEINNKTTNITDPEAMDYKKKCDISENEKQMYTKDEMIQKVYEFIECLKSKEGVKNNKLSNHSKTYKNFTAKDEKKSVYKYSNDEVIQKLCEFIESFNTKELGKTNSADIVDRSKKKPLEILIKMKEAPGNVETFTKPKYIKSPRRVSTLAQGNKLRKTPKKQTNDTANETNNDSSSTSYQSLPPSFQKCYEDVFDQENPTQSKTSATKSEPIHPLLAQYIQRLLNMKRDSVMALGISSSDIQTPNSSILNTPTNNSSDSQSNQQLNRVQKFINDNRSLIKEVEKTLNARKNATQETINLEIKDSWTNIFNDQQQSDKRKMREDIKIVAAKIAKAIEKSYPANEIEDIQINLTTEKISKPKTFSGNKGNELKSSSKMNETKISKYKTAATNTESIKIVQTEINNGEVNVSKYAALTENCTQRIAELTDLINKVRKEKQRLLEHTLSSESLSSAQNESVHTHSSVNDTVSNDEETQSKAIDSTTAEAQITTFQPLEKHKPSSGSRDSGIAMSRPNTSLEVRTDQEPINQTEGRTSKNKQTPHELTPILEIDTPLTSRTNVTNIGDVDKTDTVPSPKHFANFDDYVKCMNIDTSLFDESKAREQYNKFITNVTEKWKSAGLQFANVEDFFKYVIEKSYEDIEEEEEDGEIIDELLPFDPNCSQLYNVFHKANETLEGKKFQSAMEYMKKLSNANDMLPLDAETLDNISEKEIAISKQPKSAAIVKRTEKTNNESDSESINIEEELKRRKILRTNFARADVEISTIKAKIETLQNNESGIDALSNSDYSGQLEKELLKVGIDWPRSKRKIEKQRATLSCGSPNSMKKVTTVAQRTAIKTVVDSSSLSSIPSNVSSSTEKDYKSHLGKSHPPLNLREFLTKELLKHAELSSSSTEDSIKSNFLLSIVGTITPQQKAIMPRQKEVASSTKKWTSTPVNSPTSSFKSSFHRKFSKDTNLSSVVATSSSSSDKNNENK
ncbi:uncharacterized protein PF11_0213 isoform X2 [Teleopsis dalmanni]|uniref:uncharacterized protein PF11_0213 isoform X2 n=1 Tax=Teleopsis dalmanni TaxID=139649 RepID=UPI0018CD17F9|nr:uncharacterized protein PF11_0213 isoform X2 [Teleopsis dalmanni]